MWRSSSIRRRAAMTCWTRCGCTRQQVLAGEVWRLVTFLFDPPIDESDLCVLLLVPVLFDGHDAGSEAGARFATTCFSRSAIWRRWPWRSRCTLRASAARTCRRPTAFLYGTVFLAFARLYPDFVLYIFFVLPVKDSLAGVAAMDAATAMAFLFGATWMSRGDDRGFGAQLPAVLWPRYLAGHEAGPSADAASGASRCGHRSGWCTSARVCGLTSDDVAAACSFATARSATASAAIARSTCRTTSTSCVAKRKWLRTAR